MRLQLMVIGLGLLVGASLPASANPTPHAAVSAPGLQCWLFESGDAVEGVVHVDALEHKVAVGLAIEGRAALMVCDFDVLVCVKPMNEPDPFPFGSGDLLPIKLQPGPHGGIVVWLGPLLGWNEIYTCL